MVDIHWLFTCFNVCFCAIVAKWAMIVGKGTSSPFLLFLSSLLLFFLPLQDTLFLHLFVLAISVKLGFVVSFQQFSMKLLGLTRHTGVLVHKGS